MNQMGAQGRTDAGLLLAISCMQVCVYQKENRSKKFCLSGGHCHSFQVPVFLRPAKPAVKPFGPFSRFFAALSSCGKESQLTLLTLLRFFAAFSRFFAAQSAEPAESLRSSEMGALRRSCMSSRSNKAQYAFPRAIRVWRGHKAGSSCSVSSTVVACYINSKLCSLLPAVVICCASLSVVADTSLEYKTPCSSMQWF